MANDPPHSEFEDPPKDYHSKGDDGKDADSESKGPQEMFEFPPTRWSLVTSLTGGNDAAAAAEALSQLCEHYRPAIQAYFRIKCRDPQAAQDLANDFALHLLEKNRLRDFRRRPDKRFRNFLSAALKNFWLDHPPPPPPAEIPTPEAGPVVPADDAERIDFQIALAVYDRTFVAMDRSLKTDMERKRFDRLREFMRREATEEERDAACRDLEITSNNLNVVTHRLRREWVKCFRAEVAQMVQHQREELNEEVRYLIGLLPKALDSRAS